MKRKIFVIAALIVIGSVVAAKLHISSEEKFQMVLEKKDPHYTMTVFLEGFQNNKEMNEYVVNEAERILEDENSSDELAGLAVRSLERAEGVKRASRTIYNAYEFCYDRWTAKKFDHKLAHLDSVASDSLMREIGRQVISKKNIFQWMDDYLPLDSVISIAAKPEYIWMVGHQYLDYSRGAWLKSLDQAQRKKAIFALPFRYLVLKYDYQKLLTPSDALELLARAMKEEECNHYEGYRYLVNSGHFDKAEIREYFLKHMELPKLSPTQLMRVYNDDVISRSQLEKSISRITPTAAICAPSIKQEEEWKYPYLSYLKLVLSSIKSSDDYLSAARFIRETALEDAKYALLQILYEEKGKYLGYERSLKQ